MIEAKHVIESLTIDNAKHVVLDPFMGSGTTGIAALESNRKFIGIEINPFHYSNAVSRLYNMAT
jgi:site-specific DNA-methyltransferase (adenine-specific)